jgi:hypothetical protein
MMDDGEAACPNGQSILDQVDVVENLGRGCAVGGFMTVAGSVADLR